MPVAAPHRLNLPRLNLPCLSLTDWALLLLLSLLWGGAYFFNGVAVRELSTFTVVAARVGGGALALLLILRLMGRRLPAGPGVWWMFFVMALLNNVLPFSLIVWGQGHIAAGLAAILNATTPLFTVVVAHWLTADEKLTPARILGVAIGFGGVATLIGREALGGLGDSLLGQAACLAAAVSYALAAIYGRRFRARGLAPLPAATGQVIAAAAVLLPLALLVDRPWTGPAPSAAAWGALAGLGVLSTALGYIVYFRLIANAGATNASLVTMLIPASALLLGWAFLGERIAGGELAGMALIGLGLAVLDGRPRAYLGRLLHRGIGLRSAEGKRL